MTQMDDYKILMERSRRFLISSEMQTEKGFYDLAVFSLEQSLQLFFNAMLIKYGADYPRTHGVRRLLRILGKITENQKIEKILRTYNLELGTLEDAYITSRYILREYTREDYEKIRKAIEEILNELGGYNS